MAFDADEAAGPHAARVDVVALAVATAPAAQDADLAAPVDVCHALANAGVCVGDGFLCRDAFVTTI